MAEALGSAVVHAKFIEGTVEDDRDRNANELTPSQARNWTDAKSAQRNNMSAIEVRLVVKLRVSDGERVQVRIFNLQVDS
jgi:hypothetical protein